MVAMLCAVLWSQQVARMDCSMLLMLEVVLWSKGSSFRLS